MAATALVFAAAFTGLLRGPGDAMALGVLAAAAGSFGLWTLWSMRNGFRNANSPLSALSSGGDDPSEDWDNLSGSRFKIREPADISVIVRPSWRDGALFEADTNEPVSWGWQEQHLSEFARDMLIHLETIFRNVGDPHDPRRCALIDPADVRTIEDEAQPALDLLRRELGAERVRFEPLPLPVASVMQTDRVKIEPFQLDAVIHALDESVHGPAQPICEDEFGISWSLARGLNEWAEDWRIAQSDEDKNPDTPPSGWTRADLDAHEERGRVLAVRLRRELVTTGRPHVSVYYTTRSDGLREAHANEDIPETWRSQLA